MDLVHSQEIKYLDGDFALTQIASINSEEQVTEYSMFHHQHHSVYSFDPRNFTKKLLLKYDQSFDMNNYDDTIRVSKELRRILKLPHHNNFSISFESYFPNPRNHKQVVSLNLARNDVKVIPDGVTEFYETLLIFHVYAEAKNDEITKI